MLKYIELSNAEESFKKQKSRVQWLRLGDQNTSFFHMKMTVNRMRNKIFSICDKIVNSFVEPRDVQRVIVNFENLLGTKFAQRRVAQYNMQDLIVSGLNSMFPR